MSTKKVLPLKLLSSMAVVALLGACADMSSGLVVGGDQKSAHMAPQAADAFQEALAKGYRNQGNEDYAEGNYRSADRFYRKAIAASSGKDAGMEETAFWTSATGDRSEGLHGADLKRVQDVRANLGSWIETTKRTDPQAAAVQQVNFDCWIEEMAEQQYEHAKNCEPVMRVAMVSQAPATMADPCATNPEAYNRNGTLCRVSVINFGHDSYRLLDLGQGAVGQQSALEQKAALDQIMRQVKAIKPARIDIIGRADSSGNKSYNYGLSECRARAVVAALRTRGLPASVNTRIVPMGASDLIVNTGNNVREVKNRVVMVAYQTNRNAPTAAIAEAAPRLDTFGCGSPRKPYPAASLPMARNY